MVRGLISGKAAREYDLKTKSSEKSHQFDRFISKNITLSGAKICDLCCGTGNTLEMLSQKAQEVVGVDASPDMIKICTEKLKQNKKVRIILSEVNKTKLPSNSFDYVVMRMGLHHVKQKEATIQEILRLLKPHGKLILIDKYYTHKLKYYFREALKLLFQFDKMVLNHFVISKDRTLSLLQDFNFLKEEYLTEPDRKTTQAFMFLLEKGD